MPVAPEMAPWQNYFPSSDPRQNDGQHASYVPNVHVWRLFNSSAPPQVINFNFKNRPKNILQCSNYVEKNLNTIKIFCTLSVG